MNEVIMDSSKVTTFVVHVENNERLAEDIRANVAQRFNVVAFIRKVSLAYVVEASVKSREGLPVNFDNVFAFIEGYNVGRKSASYF